jgi:eukaryotic-like serine/threonine-protein kinase
MSDADRHARADVLLDRLLDVPAGERSGLLDAWCAGDPALRADVERLLELVDAPVGWLDPDALTTGLRYRAVETLEASAHEPDAVLGQCIGRWRLVEELGRGGMGTVYLVERADGEFEQRAALKLVRRGRELAGSARRFETERQILASLDHATIARLLDGGQTSDGRPYFVMEHVVGRPIDRHADDERLTIDERLDLFLRVAAGIEHAHQRLVVHRDIKPSNIIVTRHGEVKLLDFGIARLLSAGEASDEGRQGHAGILTPDYASPEDVRGGPATTASDVYQLGLLLYELLTGQRAQRVGRPSADALEAVVCRTAAVAPSVRVAQEAETGWAAARQTTGAALARRLRGDLDAIVRRALQKDPRDRYASVSELMADVQRYRRGLPVAAAGNGRVYRTRRFMMRHRAPLVSAAVVLVAAGWLTAQLADERLRAMREAERAEQVERILGTVFLPRTTAGQASPPAAREYVDHAVRLVQRELAESPAGQARLLARLGTVYTTLGLYGPAGDVFQQSLAIRRSTFGDDSSEAADAMVLLGESLHFRGRYQEAERQLRTALNIRRMRFGAADPSAVVTALDLGDLLHTRGLLPEAEEVLRMVLTALTEADAGPHAVARASRDLANVLRDRGELVEAERLYRQALETFTNEYGTAHTDTAVTGMYFARLLVSRGQLEEADRQLAASVSALRATFDGGHPLTAIALRNLGYLRIEQRRYDDAQQALDESLAILLAWLGPDHSMVPRTRAHQADLAWRRGQAEEAVQQARRAAAEFGRLGLSAHPAALDTCLTLAEALMSLGEEAEAGSEAGRCAAAATRVFIAGDPRAARLHAAVQRARAPAITSR